MLTKKNARWWMPVLALAVALPLSAGAALLADGKITGKVLKEDGSVAEGVPVRVMEAPPRGGPGARGQGQGNRTAQPAPGDRPGRGGQGGAGGPGGWGRAPVAETETGKDGTFTVSVPAGDYLVVAGRRGEHMGRARVTVEEGKTATLEIKLARVEPGRGNWGNQRPPAN